MFNMGAICMFDDAIGLRRIVNGEVMNGTCVLEMVIKLPASELPAPVWFKTLNAVWITLLLHPGLVLLIVPKCLWLLHEQDEFLCAMVVVEEHVVPVSTKRCDLCWTPNISTNFITVLVVNYLTLLRKKKSVCFPLNTWATELWLWWQIDLDTGDGTIQYHFVKSPEVEVFKPVMELVDRNRGVSSSVGSFDGGRINDGGRWSMI